MSEFFAGLLVVYVGGAVICFLAGLIKIKDEIAPGETFFAILGALVFGLLWFFLLPYGMLFGGLYHE